MLKLRISTYFSFLINQHMQYEYGMQLAIFQKTQSHISMEFC